MCPHEIGKMRSLSSMRTCRSLIGFTVLLGAFAFAPLQAEKPRKTRFWNLTGEIIVKFELSVAGNGSYGPDQCKNDTDGAVDDDERLVIDDVTPGAYDARVTFKSGRVCLAQAINIEDGKIFAIEAKQLANCTEPP